MQANDGTNKYSAAKGEFSQLAGSRPRNCNSPPSASISITADSQAIKCRHPGKTAKRTAVHDHHSVWPQRTLSLALHQRLLSRLQHRPRRAPDCWNRPLQSSHWREGSVGGQAGPRSQKEQLGSALLWGPKATDVYQIQKHSKGGRVEERKGCSQCSEVSLAVSQNSRADLQNQTQGRNSSSIKSAIAQRGYIKV